MPRQPVPRHLYREIWVIGRAALERRPDHAALIARCLGAWPEVELQMALMLGLLMRAQSPEAVAVYLTLRRSSSRTEALEAAAKRLNEKHLELFKAVMMVVSTTEKERNFLAHNIYAFSEAMPECIGCAHQIDLAEFALELIAKGYGQEISDIDLSEKMIKSVFTYRVEDLKIILQNIEDTWEALLRFNAILRYVNSSYPEALSDAQYFHTSALPLVQEALIRLRERAAERAQRAQPQPPT